MRRADHAPNEYRACEDAHGQQAADQLRSPAALRRFLNPDLKDREGARHQQQRGHIEVTRLREIGLLLGERNARDDRGHDAWKYID